MNKIEIGSVGHVYAGKAGKCCCGCAGKHSYASDYIAEGSKQRGYAVDPEDVNDREIARVVGLINKNADKELDGDPGYAAVEIGKRLYVAYFKA
jgi:hypothetical protein